MAQGNQIRFAPLVGRHGPDGSELALPDSRRVRLERLYPGTVIKHASNMLLVPAPRTAPIGGRIVDDEELIAWATGFVTAIFAPDQPRTTGTAEPGRTRRPSRADDGADGTRQRVRR